MNDLLIFFDPRELSSVQTALRERPEQARKALVRSINKTLEFVRSRASRGIAREHGFPLKAMKGRIRISKANSRKTSGHAWFGVKPIPAIFAVKNKKPGPPWRGLGVRAGKTFFRSAFIYPVYGVLNVFKRTGKSRLPVKRQDIELVGAERIFNQVGLGARERFETIFAQEFNFEVNVRGQGQ
jgi:hypothetical protein